MQHSKCGEHASYLHPNRQSAHKPTYIVVLQSLFHQRVPQILQNWIEVQFCRDNLSIGKLLQSTEQWDNNSRGNLVPPKFADLVA